MTLFQDLADALDALPGLEYWSDPESTPETLPAAYLTFVGYEVGESRKINPVLQVDLITSVEGEGAAENPWAGVEDLVQAVRTAINPICTTRAVEAATPYAPDRGWSHYGASITVVQF